VRCFDGTASHTRADQGVDWARLLQTRRGRKSSGGFRRTAWALTVGRAMNTFSKDDSSRPNTAEHRLSQLGIELPTPPEPFGVYAEIPSGLDCATASLILYIAFGKGAGETQAAGTCPAGPPAPTPAGCCSTRQRITQPRHLFPSASSAALPLLAGRTALSSQPSIRD
jgi:hypothetical protein